MNRLTKYTLIGILLLPVSYALIAQPTVFDRDNATPKPETPAWETERDLIVLFEDSDDRVALARLVMSSSLDITHPLTPQQRYDGLSIAGHTLFREGEIQDVIECFSGVIALNISDDASADAARMKAQSYFLLGDYAQAVNAYQLADSISRQIEADTGFHDLYRLIITQYLTAAQMDDNFDLVYSLVDEILNNYTKYESNGGNIRAQVLEIGARSARKEGNNGKAATYLTTLLRDFPDYGVAFPGPRAKLQMDLIEAQGFSFENKDPEAVEAAMNIVMDDRYYGMPIWSYYVDISARLLDENDDIRDANQLRLWAIEQLDLKLGSLPQNDLNTTMYQTAIRQSQSDLIYRTANMYEKTRQNQKATDLYQRIINDFADVTPEYAQYSNRRLIHLQNAP